jgi:hypothetical protein
MRSAPFWFIAGALIPERGVFFVVLVRERGLDALVHAARLVEHSDAHGAARAYARD